MNLNILQQLHLQMKEYPGGVGEGLYLKKKRNHGLWHFNYGFGVTQTWDEPKFAINEYFRIWLYHNTGLSWFGHSMFQGMPLPLCMAPGW